MSILVQKGVIRNLGVDKCKKSNKIASFFWKSAISLPPKHLSTHYVESNFWCNFWYNCQCIKYCSIEKHSDSPNAKIYEFFSTQKWKKWHFTFLNQNRSLWNVFLFCSPFSSHLRGPRRGDLIAMAGSRG